MASRLVPPATAFQSTSRKTKRQRVDSESHLAFIRKLPCVIPTCLNMGEAAHISYEDLSCGKLGRGKGQKEEDCWAVPLCRTHHEDQHQGERAFWQRHQIDPCRTALALWRCSGDIETAMIVVNHASN